MKDNTGKRENNMEFQNLITLIESVSASGLTELKYEENGVKIKLSKKERKVQTIQVSEALTSETAALTAGRNEKDIQSTGTGTGKENVNEENVPAGKVVASPLVGTFYVAPAEDAEAFVQIGDTVKKGQTLAIVEAMKLMNEIESDYDGTVAEVLVENGAPVEYGQPLFRII